MRDRFRAGDQSEAFSDLTRLKALETQIGRYQDLKQKTTLCDTLLTETQRNLLERTEEAKDSYRKFVDAAALLQAANDEVSGLKKFFAEERAGSVTAKARVGAAGFLSAGIAWND